MVSLHKPTPLASSCDPSTISNPSRAGMENSLENNGPRYLPVCTRRRHMLTCNSRACSRAWSDPLRQSRLGGGGSTDIGLEVAAVGVAAVTAATADAAVAATAAAAAARTGADPEKRTGGAGGAAAPASALTEMGPEEFDERGLMGLELPPAAARAWSDSSVTG